MSLLLSKRPGRDATYARYDGGSMWPCFQTGDLLVVEPIAADRLRPGDCIVYRKSDRESQIIHRIISVSPVIRTKGDARRFEDDETIAPAWILGRVDNRIRYGRSARVASGRLGVWAGKFYRYAGRLNPEGEGKGSRLARFAQRNMRWAARLLLRRASIASFDTGQESMRYLVLGKHTLGVHRGKGQAWSIAWPFCIVFDPKTLPPIC